MQIHHLSENNSVLNHFLAEIRTVNIQNDSLRFRRTLNELAR
jgi:uracil phosphoribosyltransferase